MVREKPLLIDLRDEGDIKLFGKPLRITSKKARTIVSMLALVPRHRRSRSWIWGKLWSERGEQQAAASLRQALHVLRDHFKPQPNFLVATNEYVALEPDFFDVVYPEPGETLLAGLELRDPGFEDWIEEQRRHFEVNASAYAAASADQRQAPDARHGIIGIGVLNCIAVCETSQGQVVADIVSDLIARELRNFGIAEIFDYRHRRDGVDEAGVVATGAVDCFMQISLQTIENSYLINCRFFDSLDNRQLWTGMCKVDSGPGYTDSIEFRQFVNEIVDAILFIQDSPGFAAHSERRSSSKLALAAINEILKGRHGNLKQAEHFLSRAYSMEKRSVYLGWQTHIVAYLLGERLADDPEEYRRQLAETIALAEEKGRFNPVTLALVAHAYSFVYRNYEKATEVFERMFQLHPMQAICFDLAAVTNVYVDKPALAYDQSSLALKLGKFSQYIYCIYTTHTMSSFISGHSDEAVRYGYRAIEMKPTFTANLRYLIAALARSGDLARALEVFEMLVEIEPDVIMMPFKSEKYPLAGITRDTVADYLAEVARLYIARHS